MKTNKNSYLFPIIINKIIYYKLQWIYDYQLIINFLLNSKTIYYLNSKHIMKI